MSVKTDATAPNRDKPRRTIAVGLFTIVAVTIVTAAYVSVGMRAQNGGSAIAAEQAVIFAVTAALPLLLLLLLSFWAIVHGSKMYYHQREIRRTLRGRH